MKKKLSAVFDVISKILAVLLVITLLLRYINFNYHFLPSIVETILNYVFEYGALLLAALVAMAATLRINIFLAIIMLLLIVGVAVFMFFPGTIESILPKK